MYRMGEAELKRLRRLIESGRMYRYEGGSAISSRNGGRGTSGSGTRA